MATPLSGKTQNRYKVLVAEDDPFQRLSLIDILNLSNFDPTPVENGKQALEALQDESNVFDLVLLDLLMPEMTGKDVLEAMKKDDRLKQIPVVVMSAQDDRDIIGACLATGAKDFIVKPLRVQECRGLEVHIKEEPKSTLAEKNLQKYKIKKTLGRGAAGQVDLVEHEETGDLFALKTIPLAHLNEKERNLAKSEVQFLKVLIGPTLIKSYSSYIERDKIYIIMEYAEGGNLADKIQWHKNRKNPIDPDQILRWVS